MSNEKDIYELVKIVIKRLEKLPKGDISNYDLRFIEEGFMIKAIPFEKDYFEKLKESFDLLGLDSTMSIEDGIFIVRYNFN